MSSIPEKMNKACEKEVRKRIGLKNRTKFTILAMVMICLMGVYIFLCSCFRWDFPPDSFIAGWYAAWTAELALLFGIKLKDKGEE